MKTKIDVSQIEGFESMTAEEKVQALTNFEYEDNTEVVKNYKENIDRLTHEVSQNKKSSKAEIEKLTAELKAKMSDAEIKAKEHEEYVKQIEEENAIYKTEQRVSSYTEQLVGVGYDLETAKKMATELPEGIGEDFFNGQKTFLEKKSKEFEEQALNKQPTLSVGGGETEDLETLNLMKWAGL